jgi:hypothetical protein
MVVEKAAAGWTLSPPAAFYWNITIAGGGKRLVSHGKVLVLRCRKDFVK